MTEKKELIIEFDELVPDIIKNLNRKEDAWVYQKLVKKFVKNIHDTESYDEIFEVIALNPNTSVEILHMLKKFEDEDVRENLALNPNTPKIILKDLLKDDSPYVRMALLKRSDITPEFIEALFYDSGNYFDEDEDSYDYGYEEDEFDSALNELKQLTEELKSVIDEEEDYYDNDFDDFDDDFEYGYEDFEDDVSSEIKVLIASNDKTPLSILKKLANHEDEEVREALVLNKNIDFSILKKLSEDGSDSVKSAILLRNDGNLKIKLCIDKHIEWINR